MTDDNTAAPTSQGNTEKDPADWVTGDEPMTGAQRSYLKTLSDEAHQPFDDTLTKAQASRRIDELQAQTHRGAHADGAGASGSHANAPEPDSPLESLGKAVAAPVLGADDESTEPDGEAARRLREREGKPAP